MLVSQGYRNLNKFKLTAPNSAMFSDAVALYGVSKSEFPTFEFESYMLNNFDISLTTNKFSLFSNNLFTTMNTFAGMFGHSMKADIPDRYTFTGVDSVNFSVDTFLSIYDKAEDCNDIIEAATKAYFNPLVCLFAMYLPSRGGYLSLGTLKDMIKSIATSIMPNSMQTELAQKIDAVIEKAANWADSFISEVDTATEGTVLEGLYSQARILKVPAQYDGGMQGKTYDNGGITFEYGPVKIPHIYIDDLKLSMSPMTIYDKDLNTPLPEWIKINLKLHTGFRATNDMFVSTIKNLGGKL